MLYNLTNTNLTAISMNRDTMFRLKTHIGFGLVGMILAIAILTAVGGGVYYFFVAPLDVERNTETENSASSAGGGAAAPGIGSTASSSAGAAAGAEAAKASVAEVTIQNFAFGPKELRVKVGTKVVWTNKDSVRHNAVSDVGTFEGPLLAAGESYEHVFDEAGTFPYHCAPHPNMKAVVIVE